MTTILSADIGGTKTLIELSHYDNGKLTTISKRKLNSGSYNCFANMLAGFLEPEQKIDSACFAIAGPVEQKITHQIAQVTNLPWEMNSIDIQKTFNIGKVHFINDFQAMGYSIQHLTDKDYEILHNVEHEKNGVRAIIGAGTGLGEAILAYNGNEYDVLPTEGGHIDFAATDSLEIKLLNYLQRNLDHVSYERVLSGQGLITLYSFLLEHNQTTKNQHQLDILNSIDPALEISKSANLNSCSIASQALELFMKIYGAKAGNLALMSLPTGGLYISGGIAAKNLSLLKNGTFLKAFMAKGRMQKILNKIPIYVVANQEAGLIGATQYALGLVKTNE